MLQIVLALVSVQLVLANEFAPRALHDGCVESSTICNLTTHQTSQLIQPTACRDRNGPSGSCCEAISPVRGGCAAGYDCFYNAQVACGGQPEPHEFIFCCIVQPTLSPATPAPTNSPTMSPSTAPTNSPTMTPTTAAPTNSPTKPPSNSSNDSGLSGGGIAGITVPIVLFVGLMIYTYRSEIAAHFQKSESSKSRFTNDLTDSEWGIGSLHIQSN
jgi:hypothetical protein